MFTISTLFAKSDSFSESPSIVCSVASRISEGIATNATGAVALFAGATFVGGLPVTTVLTGFAVQREMPYQTMSATTISVIDTRPGVQNASFAFSADESMLVFASNESFDEAT